MEQLSAFWDQVVTVWQISLLGVRVDRLITAAGIFLFFVLLRRLLVHFVIGALKRIVKRTKTSIDDVLLDAIEQPLTFVPIALGVFLAAQALALWQTLGDVVAGRKLHCHHGAFAHKRPRCGVPKR